MRPTVLAFLLCCLAVSAAAYSIAVTRAIEAPTIAEVFIEENRIRAELEIGDTPADEIWQRLSLRIGGRFLKPRLLSRIERARAQHDPLTGELLPAAEDAAQVVVAVVEYTFSGRPSRLTLSGPRIGFVLYHLGLPVTDLHYLDGEQTVDLNWMDPWKSQFRGRMLWRARDAKMSVFLYVEPHEVRLEVVARAMDLLPGRNWPERILAAGRGDIASQAAGLTASRFRILVDGRQVQPELDRVNYLRRRLWSSAVVDESEDLRAVSATLGIIYASPLNGYPKEVTVECDLEGFDKVAAMVTDEAASRPEMLSPKEPVLRWENLLNDVQPVSMIGLRSAPGSSAWLWPVGLVASIGGCVFLLLRACWDWYRGRPVSRPALIFGFLLLMAAGVCFRGVRSVSLVEAEARGVVHALLWNVYRAFDFRDESTVYDLLAQSVDGDLLEKTYLETRAALEVRKQGGARVRVTEMGVEEARFTDTETGRFVARCVWTVVGSVSHWGHVHQRRNRYEAELNVAAREGNWKITRLEVLAEERL